MENKLFLYLKDVFFDASVKVSFYLGKYFLYIKSVKFRVIIASYAAIQRHWVMTEMIT